jgi:hypothetical protein
MFFRTKTSGPRSYLQIVENRWEDGRPRQRVLATLGRLDHLRQSGQLDALLASGARLARSVLLLSAHAKGQLPTITTRRIGPALVFERLWRETGCQRVIEQLLGGRRFEFDVKRAVFLTVLHRLFAPGSDRAADKWRTDYQIDGCEALQLHHLYRAMAWLGEELPHDQQTGQMPFAPRCTKDRVEEGLFAHRRDLFSGLQLVYFDTTSIYFEGDGGQEIGQRGYSKDHRPDLYQMIVGAVLDGQGRPLCCELWPGNTADVTTLIPVVDRLRSRFGVGKVCVVADRGMTSQETIEALEQPGRGWLYILAQTQRSRHRPQSSGSHFAEVPKGEKKPATDAIRARNRPQNQGGFVAPTQRAKSPPRSELNVSVTRSRCSVTLRFMTGMLGLGRKRVPGPYKSRYDVDRVSEAVPFPGGPARGVGRATAPKRPRTGGHRGESPFCSTCSYGPGRGSEGHKFGYARSLFARLTRGLEAPVSLRRKTRVRSSRRISETRGIFIGSGAARRAA